MNIIYKIQKCWFPKTLKCVYRKDILKYALTHNHNKGVCYALCESLEHYGLYTSIIIYLPLVNFSNAERFGAVQLDGGYWWPFNDWTNRIKFLKWLLEQYKDDKTNLKEIII